MKVLLLGTKGMLGSYLKTFLSNSAFDLVALEREACDIASSEACREVIESRVQPDVVINAAAFTNVDLCESKPAEALRANADGPKNLAVSCQAIGARLIHFSTDYVFDGKKKEPYLETDEPNPINQYGKSKLKGDRYIQEILSDFMIVRIAGLYGEPGLSFVQKIKTQLSKNKKLKVVADQVVSTTYAKDAAEAVVGLLDRKTPRFLNITNQGACSWWEFSREIANLCHEDQLQIIPIKTSELHLPATRPAYTVLSGELYGQISGKTLRSWREALKDFLDSGN